MILEAVVTTLHADGRPHCAPMGVTEASDGRLLLQPFRPSTTLSNLLQNPQVVINATDDVRVIAGSLTGRRDWPCVALATGGYRLASALAHRDCRVAAMEDDPIRPRFLLEVVSEANHRPFRGFNRAQAAVLEAAILVSRLARLPRSKVEQELSYLQIAIEKTAGPNEHEAWNWLTTHIEDYYRSLSEVAS